MSPLSLRLSLTVSAPALAAAVLFTVARPALAALGDPDPAFGGGTGMVRPPGSVFGAPGMTVQPDGKMLLTGADNSSGTMLMTVWRYHPDGSPDVSFNGTGRASAAAPGTSGNAVLLRTDGRVLLTSNSGGGVPTFYAASFMPDGHPDLSFAPSQGGLISVPNFGPGVSTAIQPDGKIVAAGSGAQSCQLLRLLPDGTPDTSLGPGGLRNIPDVLSPFATCTAIAVQSDGKILIGRDGGNCNVSRLLPNGNLDTSFGSGGSGTASLARSGLCNQLIVLTDGKILIGGRAVGSPRGFVIGRCLPNGLPDPSFGDPFTPGTISMPVDPETPYFAGMAVQSDGRILAAGGVDLKLVLARLTADGLPDNSFGNAGLVHTNIDNTVARAVVLPPDEKLLVAGAFLPPGGGEESVVVRFLTQIPVHLSVERPAGTILPVSPPAPVNFGPVTAGTGLLEFTLRNTGLNPLTNLQAALTDESIPGDYHITSPAATLAPGAATTVTVSLTPSAAAGVRTATLRFTAGNTNPSLPPRLISLTGSRATPLEIWRVTWFGSPDNSGPGADAHDFDGDGLPNFMEYATLTHPHQYSASPCQPAGPGAFRYTRPAAALAEFSYTPESAPSPAGPWSSAGLTSTVLTDSGGVQTVQVTPAVNPPGPRLFVRLSVARQ